MAEVIEKLKSPSVPDTPTLAELEKEIQDDPNLPADIYARMSNDPTFRQEIVDKKAKGEALYEGDGSPPEGDKVVKKKAEGEGDGEGDGEGEGKGEGKQKKKRRSGYLRAAERAYEERDTIARENEELRRKLAEKTAPVTPVEPAEPAEEKGKKADTAAAKPKEDDFESYTDFMEALSDWTVEKRVSEEMAKRDKADRTRATRNENTKAASRLDQALFDQTAAAKEIHEDWQDVAEKVDEHMAAEGLAWSDAHMVAFASTGRAGDIAYYLGQHTEECENLAKAPSRDALMLQLGTLLAKIEPGEDGDADADDGEPKKVVPKPMKKHLAGTATATVKDEKYYAEDASPKEYADRELRRLGLVK